MEIPGGRRPEGLRVRVSVCVRACVCERGERRAVKAKVASEHFKTWFMVFLHCDIIKLNYSKWAYVSDYGLSEWRWCIWPFFCMEVSWRHAIQQQKTHILHLVCLQGRKGHQSRSLLCFCQHLYSAVVMVLFHFSYKKGRKETFHCEKKIRNHVLHKLLAWSSHSHSNYVHRVLVKRERALLKPHRLMAC